MISMKGVNNRPKRSDNSKGFCTASVMNFLIDNSELLLQYFEECKDEGREPSYSNFLMSCKLSGCTAEGINFNYSRIMRSVITDWMCYTYKMYLEKGELVF